MLRRGEVDLALTFTYVGDEVAADPTLLTRAIGRDPLALVRAGGPSDASAADDPEAGSGAVAGAESGGEGPPRRPGPARWKGLPRRPVPRRPGPSGGGPGVAA